MTLQVPMLQFIQALAEPDKQADLDEGFAEPYEWEPNHLYAYLMPSLAQEPFETGPTAIERFDARLVYVAAAELEEPNRVRDPDVTDLLDLKRTRYLDAIRQHQSASPYWAYARATEVAPPATLSTRAVAIAVAGYRIVN